MYTVELMIKEHDNILKFIHVVENACCGILEGKEVDFDDFENMILFARNYADKHHHGKEEQILFAEMLKHLGKIGVNLVQHGMLVEHDLGRLHILDLENSLKLYKKEPETIHKLGILEGAAGYANLLKRHIDKENNAVYPYAEKNLPHDVLESVDKQIKDFERDEGDNQVQKKYIEMLEQLTKKYC
ncbi:hemerythrin domain-containing protein [Clostridium tyrobutyricum]|uniref:hemerythrin domain-containing protein n=1 Tax=Clostridium tyrobutyricum TaxID=1519 RepID=UPI00030BD678|nr:hemerythrin domain-containing protein [Clostridium tyrobutyricum]MBV4415827.1 hemerythrin domain-containing protein [Clostridium tyrobutyricum]MBV4421754.1 hemerythrin domain-containing protein [Clostridium tyrobutyricum]MBV4438532.1 hemerythrin domain-containing protein [Clostridium tyrobutyricum]MEA5007711.1 hemerythrin domain-containing protein [Clostridium tyrobutyricum]